MQRIGQAIELTYQQQATLLAALRLYKLCIAHPERGSKFNLTKDEWAMLKNTATNDGEFPDLTYDEMNEQGMFQALEPGLAEVTP